MPKVLNFGSLNIDYVYDVPHFVRPGETLAAECCSVFCGGKGLNQSIALGRAGVEVFHAGAVGGDGGFLIQMLRSGGVDVSLVHCREGQSGHAIIQRDPDGQNCILLYGGANQSITSEEIDEALKHFEAGDYIVLQNEINRVDEILAKAKARGMKVVLNPSPISAALHDYPLELVDIFLLNELEGTELCGEEQPEQILQALCRRFPRAAVVLTLGKLGVRYFEPGLPAPLQHGIYKVKVADTTAAGDTFTGFFLASLIKSLPASEALRIASLASSLAVSRHGAAPSIPCWDEVVNSRLEPETV